MLNYDKPSRIFSCILLTRNHMIFLVQFGINKHLLIFSKTTNCTRPTGSCNFVSLWKNLLVLIYSKLHSKSRDYLYETCTFICFISVLTLASNIHNWQHEAVCPSYHPFLFRYSLTFSFFCKLHYLRFITSRQQYFDITPRLMLQKNILARLL